MKTEQQEIEEYKNWKHLCAERKYFWKVYRFDIINYLIDINKYTNYLEIGVHNGACIRQVNALHKDGVDPGVEGQLPPEVNYPITSDDFFNLIQGHDIKYDIIFIDGLHYDYQVYSDIINALNHIQPNGTIVCHDMNPIWEIAQRKYRVINHWNGDCWKAWAKLRNTRKDLSMHVVDTDNGIGIIQFGEQELFNFNTDAYSLTYEFLNLHRNELLNLISVEEFLCKFKK